MSAHVTLRALLTASRRSHLVDESAYRSHRSQQKTGERTCFDQDDRYNYRDRVLRASGFSGADAHQRVSVGVEALFREVDDESDLRNVRIGLLMQAHQIMINLAGLVTTRKDVRSILQEINGAEVVLGAKLASGRGIGAVMVLATSNSEVDLENEMNRLGFLSLSKTVQRFNRVQE